MIPSDVIGSPDPEAHQHQLCGAVEFDFENALAPVHPFNQRFQQEAGQPESRRFAVYGVDNFCRVHSTLKVTPAMEAGLTDHVWNLQELLSIS